MCPSQNNEAIFECESAGFVWHGGWRLGPRNGRSHGVRNFSDRMETDEKAESETEWALCKEVGDPLFVLEGEGEEKHTEHHTTSCE